MSIVKMTEYDEFGSILSSWTEKKKEQHSEFCIHCSVPFQTNCWNQNDEGDFHNLFVERVSEIPSSSSKIPLSQVLSTIFKLNYLKAFTATTPLVMEQQQNEEEKLLSLCLNCSQVLTQLYQLYNDFAELGKLDSYLSNQLCQLDQIMDQHQERNIHCDLKERLIVSNEEDYDDQTHQDCSHFDSNDSINLDKEDNSNYFSLGTTTTTSSTNFDREPRVFLTRLPKKYLQLLPVSTSHREEEAETVFSDSGLSPSDDGDDEDFLPENVVIKMEHDDDNEEFHPMDSITDDNASSSKKSFRNSKNKSGLGLSSHLSSTTTTAAVGTRKSNRISRKKILEPLDVKIETEKGKRSKRQNMGSKKGRTKKSKNQHSTIHRHNAGHGDGNSSSNDDDVKSKKSGRKAQIGIWSLKQKRARNYYAHRTRYANPCWYCSRTDFPSPTSVVEHTKKEHLSQLSSKKRKAAQICSRCSKISSNFEVLQAHLKKCESFPSGVILPNQYQCPQCSRTFAFKDSLSGHMQIAHSDERPFKCDQCPYAAKYLQGLRIHKLGVHSGEEISIECDECYKTLKSKRALQWHKKYLHSEMGYHQYQEKQKRRREKHASRPVITVCSDCDVDFFNRLAYHNHRRSFHGDIIGDFICELCGRDFTNANGLRLHMHGVHSEERPFLCTQCGMAFKNKSHLSRHDTNTHTTEGRLRHNEKSRIELRRRKLLAKQLAQVMERSTMVVDQGASCESSGQQQLNDVTPSLL